MRGSAIGFGIDAIGVSAFGERAVEGDGDVGACERDGSGAPLGACEVAHAARRIKNSEATDLLITHPSSLITRPK